MDDIDPTGADDVRVVVNPERTDLADDLSGALGEAEFVRPDTASGLPGAAADAVADGADVVAAVGGDGTQRTVADAVAHSDASLAIVPGGTVNLLGRVLGVTSTHDATAAIESGDTRIIDVGRCNGETFLLNASTGYDADVIHHVGDRAKRFGRLGYFAVGLARLAAPQLHAVRVMVDGEVIHEGDALSVLVMNVGYRGSTRFRVAADAEPDDGRLDVLVLAGRRRAMLRAAWAVARGGRPDRDDVPAGQGRHIDVRWGCDVASQRDGDADGVGRSFVYEVDPAAVSVRVPI